MPQLSGLKRYLDRVGYFWTSVPTCLKQPALRSGGLGSECRHSELDAFTSQIPQFLIQINSELLCRPLIRLLIYTEREQNRSGSAPYGICSGSHPGTHLNPSYVIVAISVRPPIAAHFGSILRASGSPCALTFCLAISTASGSRMLS
jgi:hypothetical protein